MTSNRSEMVERAVKAFKCAAQPVDCDGGIAFFGVEEGVRAALEVAAPNQPLSDSVKARAREILNRHTEYMDGLARGQVTMKTSNALAAVEEALASAAIPPAGGVETEESLGALSGSRPADEAATASSPSGFDPARWQPIETAPKDGADILIFEATATGPMYRVGYWETSGTNIHNGRYGVAGWSPTDEGFIGMIKPTHWMPLPAPPESAGR